MEKFASGSSKTMDSVSCLELALEGERLCKIGDFSGGVAFFEAAVKCGTNDMKTLSAIYSQLGNAYFYLSNYPKAMEYHKMDLSVAKYFSKFVNLNLADIFIFLDQLMIELVKQKQVVILVIH